MKYSFKLLFAVLLVLNSCTSIGSPEYYGVGSRNASGQAEGEWTLYKNPLDAPITIWHEYFLYGKGKYSNGKPEGLWTIWDEKGQKEAELLFSNGILNGDSKLLGWEYITAKKFDQPIIAHFENCKLIHIKGYRDNKPVFNIFVSEDSSTENDCNALDKYTSEYGSNYTDFMDRIQWAFFDSISRDGYASILKKAPQHSKP